MLKLFCRSNTRLFEFIRLGALFDDVKQPNIRMLTRARTLKYHQTSYVEARIVQFVQQKGTYSGSVCLASGVLYSTTCVCVFFDV